MELRLQSSICLHGVHIHNFNGGKESGRGLVWGNIPALRSSDSEKARKKRLAGDLVELRTRNLTKSYKCYSLSHSLGATSPLGTNFAAYVTLTVAHTSASLTGCSQIRLNGRPLKKT